jgi:hypothetical protein
LSDEQEQRVTHYAKENNFDVWQCDELLFDELTPLCRSPPPSPPKQVTHTKAAYLFRTDVASQKNTKNYSRDKTEKNMMLDFVVTTKLFLPNSNLIILSHKIEKKQT